MTVRIAAVGDVHFGVESAGVLRRRLGALEEQADLFLLAGDYTMWGAATEAAVFADDIRHIALPKFGVLGNHDFHSDEEKLVAEFLVDAGVRVLECESASIEVNGVTVG
ncbi:MAG: metallophosphoesterase, partial [Actinomycetota bacterium]|nr:metallophosphoesterase [Actinomycetota bacterium]